MPAIPMNVWEYGVSIGVITLLLAIGFWVIRNYLGELVRKDIVEANHKEMLAAVAETQAIIRATTAALIAELNDRDRACDADHKGLVAEIQRLNTNLAELTGMLTFILDHYIRNNGGKKPADGEQ